MGTFSKNHQKSTSANETANLNESQTAAIVEIDTCKYDEAVVELAVTYPVLQHAVVVTHSLLEPNEKLKHA